MEIDKADNYSNSSSDSGEMESDEDEIDANVIVQLQQKVKENPYVYDSHVNLITMLRKAGELEKLREARNEMSQIFPLTSELWLDWLIDEEKLAVTAEEKESVLSLFDKAVKDYASVNVWLEYCQYVIGVMGTEEGIDRVRKTFDRALTAVGINVAQGSLIWDSYREFENAILSSMQASQTDEDNEEEKKKVEIQKNRVFSLYRRQLSVPLLFMEKTYEEFRELTEIDPYIEQQYQKALQMLKKLQPYEDALYKSEAPHLEEYKRYIEFEVKEKNPARIQNIYERALVENCLLPELWCDYTKYVDRVIKSGDIVLPIHERAIRNCPWSVLCWNNYLLALERHKQPHSDIKAAFEKSLLGLTNGEEFCQIWTTYLDYLRRRIKWNEDHESELGELNACFERAIEHLSYYDKADKDYSILKYWAQIKAKYCKDLSHAREIWSSIVRQRFDEEQWMQYANFERLYGDDKHYKKILLKGLQSKYYWPPETLGAALIEFERKEGTLESLDSSTEKYEKEVQRINEFRKKQTEADDARRKKLERLMDAERKNRLLEHIFGEGTSKFSGSEVNRKVEPDVQMDAEGFKIPCVPSRLSQVSDVKERSYYDEYIAEREQHKRLAQVSGVKERGYYEEYVAEQEKHKRKRPIDQESADEENSSHGTIAKHDPLKDDRSVFLSNLSYDITEDKIKESFSSIGDIEEIRLVKDYKGRSKGFCYVVFTSQEDAKKALGKDREFLEGRPVFVSPCEDKKTGPPRKQFKFGTGLEKNKLFIKGLPFSTTKEDLVEIFKEFGQIKEIRVVTYRNGHSKGLAYVEYENEASASAAVVKTDGLVIQEHTISVAISNPPERKPKQNPKQSNVTISALLGGGGGSSSTGPRGRGRTQLTLLPRSLQKSQAAPKTSTKSANGTVQNGGSESSEKPSDGKKLSNDDFRNMLLKK